MTAQLTIRMSDEVLAALQANRSITISLAAGGRSAGGGAGRVRGAPRAGSHPARISEWAAKRGQTFGTREVEKLLGVSRPHASMLLSRMATSGQLSRPARGKYRFGGAPASASGGAGGTEAGSPREGSLPARVIDWAAKRGKNFGIADAQKRFKLSRSHASMLLSTMVKAGRIARASRGVYRIGG